MNFKIAFVMMVIFIIVFTCVFYFNQIFTNISEEKFYNQDFDTNRKKILIYGSSHFVQLNSTLITDEISKTSKNYFLINMAENGDTPQRRIGNVEKDLTLQPELVVYGIGFRDFNVLLNNKNNNEKKIIDLIPWDTTELQILNPKLTSLEVLRVLFVENFRNYENQNIPYPNTSIFSDRVQETIVDEEELKSKIIKEISIPNENNVQAEYFIKIIKKLKENNVKVLIVITPYHSFALEQISENDKNNFYEIISNIENELDVKIIDLSERYSKFNIWRDPTHIAFNEKSMIFSRDVSQAIIQEIEK